MQDNTTLQMIQVARMHGTYLKEMQLIYRVSEYIIHCRLGFEQKPQSGPHMLTGSALTGQALSLSLFKIKSTQEQDNPQPPCCATYYVPHQLSCHLSLITALLSLCILVLCLISSSVLYFLLLPAEFSLFGFRHDSAVIHLKRCYNITEHEMDFL